MKNRPVLFALLAALGLSTALHAQSLADAARKAEEGRAKAKQERAKSDDTEKTGKASATKVYTNESLVDGSPAPAPAQTKTKPTANDTPATVVKSENWWRSHALGL